jgi:triacylglycerol lipase
VSTHPLFTGGKEDWVHSITTISTPNQGTLLADVFHSVSGLVTDALVAVFSSLNVLGDIGDDFYDAKLDQWGISPKGPHESLKQYMTRVFHSPLFAPGVKDMALWSLSTSGAAEESTWVETLPSIYYFSYATVDTHASHDRYHRNVHKANFFTMFFALQPLGNTLGGRLAPDRGFSEEWQANDGVVNSISMCNDAKGDYVVFTDMPKRGVWNGMPTLEPMDHIAVVGLTIHTNVLKKLYNAHAKLLRTLPITADEKVAAGLHKQQQLACGHIHEAVGELCEEAAAAEAAMREKQLASSEQEPPEEESRITQVAWEADDTVKPIPVYEAEPW